MISYWVTQDGRFGIDGYRANRGLPIADRFQTHVYERIERTVRVPAGAQIFSALDQLTDGQREVVAAIWDAHAHAAPHAARLNDPRRVLRRLPLLEALYKQGLNAYRVFRATDPKHVDRFPVFVRHVNDHSGPRTRLLTTPRELAGALSALRVRGYRLADLMIVEFCDTSDGTGEFRKFSAFKVGDHIIPCHLLVSRHWCVKSGRNETTEASLRAGTTFVEENPHREWLARIFEVSGIDYGRVDYGIFKGQPQVWEINLNPTIGRGAGGGRNSMLPENLRTLREQHREAFHSRLRAAFTALDAESGESSLTVSIGGSLWERTLAEVAATERRARAVGRLSRVSSHSRLGFAARAILRLFPRH